VPPPVGTPPVSGAAPVINSFTEAMLSGPGPSSAANVIYIDPEGNFYDWLNTRDTEGNEFRWNASGADRYEIVYKDGTVLYSGTATRFNTNDQAYIKSLSKAQIHASNNAIYKISMVKSTKGKDYITLRAYNGSIYSETQLLVSVYQNKCGDCSM
jgi:hypothetical protein